MMTFEEFYRRHCKRISEGKYLTPHDAMRAAFEAGQASRTNVITAAQVKEYIVDLIADNEAEANALANDLNKKDLFYPAELVLDAMEANSKRYRTALTILTEAVEQLESERAEVSR